MKTNLVFIGTFLLSLTYLTAQTPALETVQRFYGYFASGDMEAMSMALADDVAWTDPGTDVSNLYIGTRKGKAEVLDFFRQLNRHLEISTFEPHDFLTQGKRVVVTGYVAGKAIATGRPFATDWMMDWEIDDAGKVSRHHLYLDTDNLNKAIGGAGEKTGLRFLAAMDANDLPALKEAVSPDFRICHPNFPEPLTAEAFFEQQVKPVNAAIANIKHDVVDSCAEGKRLVLRGIVTGKHTGELTGIPATGNDIMVPWIAFATLDDSGKIRELHVQFNQIAFLTQLGKNPMAKK